MGNPDQPGVLLHEMSNSLAAVMTNLNLLVEAGLDDARLQDVLAEALTATDKLSHQMRGLRALQWAGETAKPSASPALGRGPDIRASVLVIDDEQPILTAVSRVLRKHDVHTTTSAKDALSLLDSDLQFDIILCDLIMEGMSGMAFYTHLMERQDGLDQKVLFMTGGGFTTEARSFLQDVPNAVLHKPFDAKTLRWVVQQHLTQTIRQTST